ncbi:MAG: adenosylcobinamide-phosphate synthase CbiB [Archaeoglobaceae archaeon]
MEFLTQPIMDTLLLDNGEKILVLFLAIALDLLIGEPRLHPTNLFGKLTSSFDRIYVRRNKYIDFITGSLLTLLIIGLALLISLIPNLLPYWIGLILLIYLTKTTFGIKSLVDHVKRTATPDINEQRQQTSLIVSRDVRNLERHELCSASIESLSENMVDSVISPIFYFLLFGLPGALIYRAVNTMDALIGYRDDQHFYVGKFTARLDDVLNFIPSRITFLLFMPLARSLEGFKYYRLSKKINDKSIAGMSAVLGVKLEKKFSYSYPGRKAQLNDIGRSLKVFKIVTLEWLAIAFTFLTILYLL